MLRFFGCAGYAILTTLGVMFLCVVVIAIVI